ncbi:GTA baseplate fiber-binding domain-containing protein [Sphingomonas sp. Leaf20]|uniref:GTA baseplate fiber-binding domain-containing protein n=1 Tax=Sphingomonas sp. Leaf20 TaxID=1735685 RepID=UPI000702167C|nr:phage tail protein [Sphingomonas sp. Leaf20]KQM73936.1 hypothetical protein ASE72_05075 [Sphingomonas sp. Leaf20]
MATLVLTAVGSAVGGPIGGAIGALIGRSVDGLVLRPGRREGPRLTELAVQTSSYGSQIPALFGTMRVAGTVIWASDLIETRSRSGGGKGQPSVSTYSYAASFAVLLSARRVLRVGRIWAEGKLLRGAGGDFKTATGFRLHPGGETQAVDPLIAAAEGAGVSPAYRGCAYVVFEQMALAAYGNRIPSLTFEVIADAGAVGVATIARAVAAEVTEGTGEHAGEAAMTLDGFAVAGGSVGAVLTTLAQAAGGWFAPGSDGTALTLCDPTSAAGDLPVIVDAGVRAGVSADGRGTDMKVRAVAASDSVPRTMTIGYYDAARDYQTGLQRVRRAGAGPGGRDERIALAAVLSAGAAKTIAAAVLARAEAERVRRTVRLGPGGLARTPGSVVRIADAAGVPEPGIWRIVESMVEAMVTTLVLTPVEIAPVAVAGSSGRVAAAVDAVIGASRLAAFETPGLEDAPLVAPRLTVAAAGSGAGWRQAALLYSIDDGASWIAAGATAAPATMGRIAVVAAARGALLCDAAGVFEVVLARPDMLLADADDAGLDAGRNLALAGDELIQFGRADPVGAGRWRLTRLWRGRRGTEAAIGTQAPGDAFVLIEADAMRTIDLPVAAIGQTVRVLASGVGDTEPVEARCVLAGRSVLPPSPVGLRVALAGNGDAAVRWIRRSRAGWRWIDGGDVPLGEDAEVYVVRIVSATGAVRTVETSVSSVTVTGAERSAGPVAVEVRQRGLFGLSAPARIMVAAAGEAT